MIIFLFTLLFLLTVALVVLLRNIYLTQVENKIRIGNVLKEIKQVEGWTISNHDKIKEIQGKQQDHENLAYEARKILLEIHRLANNFSSVSNKHY